MLLKIIAAYIGMVVLGFVAVAAASFVAGKGFFMGLPPQFTVFVVLFSAIPFTIGLFALTRKN